MAEQNFASQMLEYFRSPKTPLETAETVLGLCQEEVSKRKTKSDEARARQQKAAKPKPAKTTKKKPGPKPRTATTTATAFEAPSDALPGSSPLP